MCIHFKQIDYPNLIFFIRDVSRKLSTHFAQQPFSRAAARAAHAPDDRRSKSTRAKANALAQRPRRRLKRCCFDAVNYDFSAEYRAKGHMLVLEVCSAKQD